MLKLPQLLTIFLLGLLFSNQILAGTKDKYIINPVVTDFDSFPSLPSTFRYFISYDDSTDKIDTTPAGFTRTGIKSQAPIFCSPSITIGIKKSMQALFEKNNILTQDPTTASYIVKVKLLNFSLEEKSFPFYQTMENHIKFELTFIDPFSAGKQHSLIIESRNSESAMDTSNHAEHIVKGTLRNALLEFVKTLKSDHK